ncbi:MAG: CopG family transcriptional regulator [Acidimicrobiales bacterium]
MKRTNLYLDEGQTTALDEVARGQGISRAELVRRLVDRGIGTTPRDLHADLSAIEESFGVLGDDQLPGRGPDARTAHLDQMRRL